MAEATHERLFDALLDSWDRNNAIMVGLLRVVPEGGLAAKAMPTSASVGQMYMHMHYIRLVHVFEDAPEFARDVPTVEWPEETDGNRIAALLTESAAAVRDALVGRLKTGQEMDMHYDHPVLMLQHLVWHEAYHHGQIKLTLKLAGMPIADDVAGDVSWAIWMDKRPRSVTT